MTLHTEMFRIIRENLVPPLLPHFYKGQLGKLAVIGGCKDYTGAPYFSGHAAMLSGVDLVHIICEENAGSVIKGYSPDLMVHPYLFSEINDIRFKETWPQIVSLLERMDAVVIGPGFGRYDDSMKLFFEECLKYLCQNDTNVILDADALYHLSTDSKIFDIVRKATNPNIVLTPNVAEFKRFGEKIHELPVTVIQKGSKDEIASRNGETVVCDEPGSLKRVGGQGDTLTGVIGAFLCWGNAYRKRLYPVKDDLKDHEITQLCCLAGCTVVRRSAKRAYEIKGRSMLATDVHPYLSDEIDNL